MVFSEVMNMLADQTCAPYSSSGSILDDLLISASVLWLSYLLLFAC